MSYAHLRLPIRIGVLLAVLIGLGAGLAFSAAPARAESGWPEVECKRQNFTGTYNGQDCSQYALQDGEEILQKTSSVNAVTGRTVEVLSCVYYSNLGRAQQPGEPPDCGAVEAAQRNRNTRLYGSQNPCAPATPATGYQGCRRQPDGTWQPVIVKNQGWRNQQNLQNFGLLSKNQIVVRYNGQERQLYRHVCTPGASCEYVRLDGVTIADGHLQNVLRLQTPFTYAHDPSNPYVVRLSGDDFAFSGEYRFRSDGRVVFNLVEQ